MRVTAIQLHVPTHTGIALVDDWLQIHLQLPVCRSAYGNTVLPQRSGDFFVRLPERPRVTGLYGRVSEVLNAYDYGQVEAGITLAYNTDLDLPQAMQLFAAGRKIVPVCAFAARRRPDGMDIHAFRPHLMEPNDALSRVSTIGPVVTSTWALALGALTGKTGRN